MFGIRSTDSSREADLIYEVNSYILIGWYILRHKFLFYRVLYNIVFDFLCVFVVLWFVAISYYHY